MMEKQWKKDYHLQPDIENKVSLQAKDLIVKLLEPKEEQRPDIWTVCSHPFFPIVHQEDEQELLLARERKRAATDPQKPQQTEAASTEQDRQ